MIARYLAMASLGGLLLPIYAYNIAGNPVAFAFNISNGFEATISVISSFTIGFLIYTGWKKDLKFTVGISLIYILSIPFLEPTQGPALGNHFEVFLLLSVSAVGFALMENAVKNIGLDLDDTSTGVDKICRHKENYLEE